MEKTALTFFGLVLSCIVLSLIVTLIDFYFCFRNAFKTIHNLLSSTRVKNAASASASASASAPAPAESSCICREYLSREELEIVMEKLGTPLDSDDGKLQEKMGFREIAALFSETEPTAEEVKQAFDVFDTNGDGYIDANELRKVLHQIGVAQASEDECRGMILAFDDDGDGQINLEEFVKLMGQSMCP